METKYELNNTKKVANAFGLNEEDTNLLINAVDLDIKNNMQEISSELQQSEQSKLKQYGTTLQNLAKQNRIIK
ncbi:capsid morphogenesis B protein [Staphylococcus aureus]|uniref:capsid morphogenesis B protein n=1 Tax=Staphylococcus aureus TaxID=1280 RepID=UPI0001C37820|nr:capsid morphogenesis B protein [Staphylococcus aureus]HDH6253176.1 capsid morphogenesis B protein [Staphylococcus aureus LTCF-9-33]HDH6259371.1 capsid morphogenesis B protein [Staphylococcus aureus LTCF-8-31]HDH6272488.1 capsid morphogenesis B protein [Staphylococcus aureus LTCF-6-28]HDH6431669.1 capsid morphogenesis B protein [Staphylococcus aureus MRSA-Lux-29]HDH6437551.1 capsid morphogenesis B protein [Staphylococcus aureus MRSA-Lux-28]